MGDDDTLVEETREPVVTFESLTFCNDKAITPATTNCRLLANWLAVLARE